MGQRCLIDTVSYIDLDPDGHQFSNDIVRHNCQTPKFYCDRNALQCFPTKEISLPCELDQECRSVRFIVSSDWSTVI